MHTRPLVIVLCLLAPAVAQKPVSRPTASVAAAKAKRDPYAVKAAALYHFARYVRWPRNMLRRVSDTFVIGVAGKDPFGNLLERVFQDKTLHGHRIEIKRFTHWSRLRDREAIRRCHVLFVAAKGRQDMRAVLRAVAGAPVLVVGDDAGIVGIGGAIGFFVRGGKLRFDISRRALRRSRLEADSRLLRLARNRPRQRKHK